MGLGPAPVRLYLELWQRGWFKNIDSVMEMGSQELMIPDNYFDRLVHSAGIEEYDAQAFENLKHSPKQPRVSARHLYELLGAKNYSCIDLNKVYGAIPHDLNTPLEDESLFSKYDLVTDHGTNEHVFNVPETYRTMHRMCKTGGLMAIHQCTYGGNGYYNFDLSFFEGMAAANGYHIIFSSYIVTVPMKYLTNAEKAAVPPGQKSEFGIDEFHIPLSNELLDVVDWSKNSQQLGICYVFQKQSDDDFKYAYQGVYQSRVYGNNGYTLQFSADPPSRTYLPMVGDSLDGISGKKLFKALASRMVKKGKSIARIG